MSLSLASWDLETGPPDAPTFPEAALCSTALVAHALPQAPQLASCHKCHSQLGPQLTLRQMSCLHLHPFHTVQPEEREGEATGQTEPRSQCLLSLPCSVCWKLDHEVYRNQGL